MSGNAEDKRFGKREALLKDIKFGSQHIKKSFDIQSGKMIIFRGNAFGNFGTANIAQKWALNAEESEFNPRFRIQ